MRSISEIVNLVVDGQLTTQEQANALIEDEVADRAKICNITEEEARSVLLANIGYTTGYMTHAQADTIMELFNIEHPVWGRTHPTPDEIVKLGMEAAARRQQKEKD